MNELLVILAENSACVLLQMLIIVPLAAALLLFVIPDRFQLAKGLAALAVTLYLGYISVGLWSTAPQMVPQGDLIIRGCMTFMSLDLLQKAGEYVTFTVDGLSKLIVLSISVLSLPILVYSLVYNKSRRVSHF